jgi:hypothetical protein
MAAADPGLTLCPDAYLRTLTVPPTPSRARRQPVGVARLTSRMKWYPRVIDGTSYATGYIDTFVPGTERAGHHEPMYTALKGTLHRMSGADCVVQLEVEDRAYSRMRRPPAPRPPAEQPAPVAWSGGSVRQGGVAMGRGAAEGDLVGAVCSVRSGEAVGFVQTPPPPRGRAWW